MRRRDLLKLAPIPAVETWCGCAVLRKSDLHMRIRDEISKGVPQLSFRLGMANWQLVRILVGKFVMGTPLDEPGRESWELEPRSAVITRPFYIAKYEATNAQ